MAFDLAHVETLAKRHPMATAAIVVGGVVVVVWLLGGFSSGAAAAPTSGSLDQAYYAAEAIQSQANSGVQIATLNDAAETAIAQSGFDSQDTQAAIAGATSIANTSNTNASATTMSESANAAAIAIANTAANQNISIAAAQAETQRESIAGQLQSNQAQFAAATTIASDQVAENQMMIPIEQQTLDNQDRTSARDFTLSVQNHAQIGQPSGGNTFGSGGESGADQAASLLSALSPTSLFGL